MARPTKFLVIWGGLTAAALYRPVQAMLTTLGYSDSEQFFEDLLSLVTGLSIVVVPICILIALSSRRPKDEDAKETTPIL